MTPSADGGDLRTPDRTIEAGTADEDEGFAVTDLVVRELDDSDTEARHGGKSVV